MPFMGVQKQYNKKKKKKEKKIQNTKTESERTSYPFAFPPLPQSPSSYCCFLMGRFKSVMRCRHKSSLPVDQRSGDRAVVEAATVAPSPPYPSSPSTAHRRDAADPAANLETPRGALTRRCGLPLP
jgi:hypothetical protein